MNRTQKETFISEFRDKVQRAPVMYFTDFSGLDVKSMVVLRDELRNVGAEFVVIKNRLAKRAIAEMEELPDIADALLGPTGVVFGYEDVVEPAKALSDFAKDHNDRPVFKAGILDRKVLGVAEIQRLAKLPPKEQLLAQLAGVLEAPMAAFASALEGKVQEMSGLLDALIEKKESEG